jgi:protein-disulfide isomerase
VNKYLLAAVAALLLAVFVIGSRWYAREEANRTAGLISREDELLVRPYSPSIGPARAEATVVEFLDPECESCAAMHPIVKHVLREFDGRLRLVIRYMPLHGNSEYASGLLEGAREQNRYWELMDEFFTRQPEWASHAAPRPDLLLGYARRLGLDDRALVASAQQAVVLQRIRQDRADGMALGVRQTPTIFVNGRVLDRLGYEPLRAAIQNALGSADRR